MKKTIRLTLGCAFSGLFIWLIFRNLSLYEIGQTLSKANLYFIVMAVFAFFVGYACRIERWRLMLTQDNPALLWKNSAGPLMASVAANNVLPFRAGDFLRAFGFNRKLGISTATSLTALLIERLLDLLMIALFLGLALTYFGIKSSAFIGPGAGFISLAGTTVLLLLALPSLFKPTAFRLCRLLSRMLPKLGPEIHSQFQKVFTALAHTSKGSNMLKLIFWSLLAWIAEGFVFWFVAISLPSTSNNLAAWLALPIATLTTVIPGTPGYIGTFDYFTAQAMVALGNPLAGSIAFAFLVHAVLWLPPSIVGGLYLLTSPMKQRHKIMGMHHESDS